MTQPAPTISPATLDLEAFSHITTIGAQIATMIATDGSKQLGLKFAAMLSDHVDNNFPQATKFNAAVAKARTDAAANLPAQQARVAKTYHDLWDTMFENALANPPGHDDTTFLKSVGDALRFPGACAICRVNYLAYLKKNPPNFTTPETYFEWMWNFKNYVNMTSNPKKPTISLEQAKALYAA